MKIDNEFKTLIPPMTAEERAQLEESIVSDGCRDALVVWLETDILLDGHNRFDICQRHDIEFRTVGLSLPNRAAAFNWIINNQIGRRNVTPEQASYLRGKRYQSEKRPEGRPNKLHQNDVVSTAQRLADEYKVSKPTIERDAQYAFAVDTLVALAGDDARQTILSGDTPISKKDVIHLAKQAEAEPEAVREKVSSMAVHYSSETPEWYTPNNIIFRTLTVLEQIDLDPCSNSHETPNVPAAHHFTKDDDGLSRDWLGRVYMNPPYGREIIDWIRHLCEQYEAGNITEAIALVPSRTDTEWFRMLRDYPHCFVWGRLKFSSNDTPAPFPSMAVYLGSNPDKFISGFKDIGDIYECTSASGSRLRE